MTAPMVPLLADSSGGGIVALIFMLFWFVIYIAIIAAVFVGLWKVYVKMGQPGWAGIVPIYNVYVLIQLFNKPMWYLILSIIPCTAIVPWFLLSMEMAKRFGKSDGFGVGIALLSPIFLPLLGFSDATYMGGATPPPVGFPTVPPR